jgi:hypothetical protein
MDAQFVNLRRINSFEKIGDIIEREGDIPFNNRLKNFFLIEEEINPRFILIGALMH